MSNAVAVTDADFEQEIEKHDGLAVVDFWATWCGPCRMIAPILDQLAVEYQGKAKVAKLDVDSNIRTATRFNVRSIPAVLFFKNGKLVDQVTELCRSRRWSRSSSSTSRLTARDETGCGNRRCPVTPERRASQAFSSQARCPHAAQLRYHGRVLLGNKARLRSPSNLWRCQATVRLESRAMWASGAGGVHHPVSREARW
jgi:thioredoxin 1